MNNLCPFSAEPVFNVLALGTRAGAGGTSCSSWNVTTFFSAEERRRVDDDVDDDDDDEELPQSLPDCLLLLDVCDPTDPTSEDRARPYSSPCFCLRASKLALRCSSSSAVDLTIFSGWW